MSAGFDFRGPSGRLEALLEAPVNAPLTSSTPLTPGGDRRPGAVLAHPHPLRGGTMHNTVVYRTAKALAAAGIETLRFNFRGVGRSDGKHDEGVGEQQDYAAAIDALDKRGRAPIFAGGYSFGAIQAIRVAARDPRILAICAIGFPLTIDPEELLLSTEKRLLVVQGDHDSLAPIEALTRVLSKVPNATLVVIPGAGHFFDGKEADVASAVADYATKLLVKT